MLAEMARDMLKSLGYHVTVAKHPTEAWNLFLEDPSRFDLVVTDQTMPHLVGTRLAEEAMKVHPGLPVVLCTGFSDCVSERTAAGLGLRELVMKPFSIREMAVAIRRALDRPAG